MRTLSLTSLLMLALCLQGCGGSDAPSDTPDSGSSGSEPAETDSSLGSPGEMPETTENSGTEESGTSASADGSTLNYIPEDAVAAVVIHPAKALNNPIVKELIALAEEANPNQKVSDQFAKIKDEVGITPDQVDHVLVVIDQQFMQTAPMMMMGAPPAPPVVVIQLVDGVNTQQVFDAAPPEAERIQIAGGEAVETPDGSVIFKVSDSRLVFSSKEKLEGLLSNSSSGQIRNMIEKSADADFGLALNLEPVKALLQQAAQGNPMMGFVMPIVQQMQTLSIAADLEAENLLQISVSTPDAEAAQAVEQSLTGFLQMGKQQYSQAKADVPAEMQPMAQALVDGATLSASESVVSLTVPRPADFEKLPEMLKPAFAEASKAANRASRRNDMKQIGLAFHNYHDVYNHFPAVDANGEKEEGAIKGKGLSWRVHLLPFLDHLPLYEQFNMDEAWDSEGNKALIAQMPAVFGENPEGKTSVHVFVGEGLAFNEEKPGPQIRDYTDGTSNTFLAVKAGDDTAEIWTKPGGLAFNAEDPHAALGNIGEMFMALICDGSVRDVPKSIDKTNLSNLIQQNDGNPVDF